jgi:hypothetical protein
MRIVDIPLQMLTLFISLQLVMMFIKVQIQVLVLPRFYIRVTMF